MRKLFILDTNEQFASYCCGEFFMDENEEYDAIAVTNMLDIEKTVDAAGDSMLVCNVSCLAFVPQTLKDAMQGRIAVYADTLENKDAALASGFPSYGCTPSAKVLYNAILKGQFASPKVAAATPAAPARSDAAASFPEPSAASVPTGPDVGSVWDPDAVAAARKEEEDEVRLPDDDVSLFGRTDNWNLPTSARRIGRVAPPTTPAAFASDARPSAAVRPTVSKTPPAAAEPHRTTSGAAAPKDAHAVPRTDAYAEDAVFAPRPVPQPKPEESMREQFARLRQEEADRKASERIRKDTEAGLGHRNASAVPIVVTSGKGGVGKTTIAASLALLLARTDSGRGKLDVCLVDNNVDFGNVLGTLELSDKGPNSAQWATDITERVESGMTTEYTREEMDNYLQTHKESGLRVLCAPATNIDSFLLDDRALSIMLHNLVDNGGFDYIVIDTGNNTRDSTYRSVKIAKYVFLVVTQDINAVMSDMDCFHSFAALRENGKPVIDMSKFSVILNMRRPAREVGMPVEEALEFMADRAKPYVLQCIAEIDYAKAVSATTNLGDTPLVLSNPSHPFSVAIGKIARYVHKEELVLAPIQKKGFFARLREKMRG